MGLTLDTEALKLLNGFARACLREGPPISVFTGRGGSILKLRRCITLAIICCATALLGQNSVSLQGSETLFTVLTAINTCGYDTELPTSDALRLAVRGEVGRNIEASEDAKAATEGICGFYRDHQQRDDTKTLSQYISLALYLNPPPDFASKVKEADLPPEVSGVLGFVPLLAKFYAAAGIHEVWLQHAASYSEFPGKYRDAVSKMIFDTELYLKLPSGNYLGRTFTIYIDPMGAPSQTNARNYADDYYVVLTPGTNTGLKMDLIRHAFLHYLLDPLVGKYAANLAKLEPIMDALKLAPLDESFKADSALLVTECVIRAVEARTLGGGKTPQAQQDQSVEQSMQQGFTLTQYFYDRLLAFEKGEIGFKNAFPAMLAELDVRKEQKRTSQIQFATSAEPEVLHLSRPKEGKLLVTAMQRLSAGDSAQAEKLAKQALAEKSEDPGQAMFILAQISLNRNINGARDYFEKALQATSEPRVVAWSHIYLGRIFDLEDERDTALLHYKAAEGASETLPEAKAAAEQGLEKPYQAPTQPAKEEENK
jgi:hypothetical protein